jgi:hypothetical protein
MKRTALARRSPLAAKSTLKSTTKLKGGRSTGKPTKAQVKRFEAIVAIGCIACRQNGMNPERCEVHHLNVCSQPGGKRRGHDFTIGLCPWHHRADPMEYGTIYMLKYAGPTWAQHKRKFIETFGTDDVLLAYQNDLIKEMK